MAKKKAAESTPEQCHYDPQLQESVKQAGLDLSVLEDFDFNQLRDLVLLLLKTLRKKTPPTPSSAAKEGDPDPAAGLRRQHRTILHRILGSQSDALGETVDALRNLDND